MAAPTAYLTINNLIEYLNFIPPVTNSGYLNISELDKNEIYSLMLKYRILIPTHQIPSKVTLDYLRSLNNKISPDSINQQGLKKLNNLYQNIYKGPTHLPMELACIIIANEDEYSKEDTVLLNRYEGLKEIVEEISSLVNRGLFKKFDFDNSLDTLSEKLLKLNSIYNKDKKYKENILNDFFYCYLNAIYDKPNETIQKAFLGEYDIEKDFGITQNTYLRRRFIINILNGTLPTTKYQKNINDMVWLIEKYILKSAMKNKYDNKIYLDSIGNCLLIDLLEKGFPPLLYLDILNFDDVNKKENKLIGKHRIKKVLLGIKKLLKNDNINKIDTKPSNTELLLNQIKELLKSKKPSNEGCPDNNQSNKKTTKKIIDIINKINNYRATLNLNQQNLPNLHIHYPNSYIDFNSITPAYPDSNLLSEYLKVNLKQQIIKEKLGCSDIILNLTKFPYSYKVNFSLYSYGDIYTYENRIALVKTIDSFLKRNDNNNNSNTKSYKIINLSYLEDMFDHPDKYYNGKEYEKCLGLILDNRKNKKNSHYYHFYVKAIINYTDNQIINMESKIPIYIDFSNNKKWSDEKRDTIIKVLYYKYKDMLKISELFDIIHYKDDYKNINSKCNNKNKSIVDIKNFEELSEFKLHTLNH
jgi:hypothetical protein